MGRVTLHGTAETVSRDQNLRRKRGQGYFHFPCSVDEQDWQPYPVDIFSAISVMTILTYNHWLTSCKSAELASR